MEENEKKSLFKKISDKWAQARDLLESKTEMVKEKLHNAKETIKEKFSKTKTKIVVRVASLVLTGAMAASMASCSFNSIIDTEVPQKESNSQHETIINQEENQNNPGYTIPGENNNDITHGNNSGENNLTETEQQREYSQALQYVLNNPEYNALIAQAKREASNEDHPTYNKYFDSVPYGFFEKQGYNVNALKNETLECFAFPFFKSDEPNNLYVVASAETSAERPYLTQYVLKFKLTEQQAEEFKWLHKENYLQAFLMVDAYSQLTTPEIVNECKITVRAFNGLSASLGKNVTAKALIDNQNLGSIAMLNFSPEEGKAQILLIGNNDASSTAVYSALNVANIANDGRSIKADENGAYDWSYTTGAYKLDIANNSTEYESATRYSSTASFSDTQTLNK